ncbi:hypothetical protein SCHPADRAFT_936446 [Schizopora paradoxa]|uniref:DUF6697 domain-containing protein n=1 Tax=Schizopora paradoxa TaxID=27342 RepID=A0A0H2S2C1_9AGAM|nr:hypothetical protein SCHPADRAFT_936446 [Schizopora paradoxa]
MDAPLPEPLWTDTDAYARTYLWSQSLQATPFFYDPNPSLSGPYEFESYSAPPSPTHPTFIELMKELAMEETRAVKPEITVQPNTPLQNIFEPPSPFQSSDASSSSNGASHPCLPSSPRNPVPRRSTVSHGPNGAPNSLLSPPRALAKSRSVPNFAGITKHPRSTGRKFSLISPSEIPPVPLLPAPSRTSSPTPSIILTTPESPRGSTSSVSLFSSSYEDSETSYSSSSDMDPVVRRRSTTRLPGLSPIHEARLRKLAQIRREEPLVPDTVIPNHIVTEVFDSQPDLELLTLDASEYLPHPFSRLKPGTHGLIVPCAWSLIDLLALHGDLNLGETHLFLSNGHSGGQRYLGLYRIVRDPSPAPLSLDEWVSIPTRIRHAVARVFRTDLHGRVSEKQIVENLRMLNLGEQRLYPVLLQFVRYDWELFDSMAERIDREAMGLSKEKHTEVRKSVPRKLQKKRKAGRNVRVVTVDGMTFEMLTPM